MANMFSYIDTYTQSNICSYTEIDRYIHIQTHKYNQTNVVTYTHRDRHAHTIQIHSHRINTERQTLTHIVTYTHKNA